jgi:hypothetical protein
MIHTGIPKEREKIQGLGLKICHNTSSFSQNISPIGKGKAIPLQALTCSEGSRRLRLPDLKTIGT